MATIEMLAAHFGGLPIIPLESASPFWGYKESTEHLDLWRFDAAPLIAFTAAKETANGTETDERISPRRGADRTDQWANAQASG